MMQQAEMDFGASAARAVAVIGGAGLVGRKVLSHLSGDRRTVERVLSIDLREVPASEQLSDVAYVQLDMRSAELSALLRENGVDCVVHLAAVQLPEASTSTREQYRTDVDGTHQVVDSCLTADVRHLIVLSSGAVYGFWPGETQPLPESAPLRGNEGLPHALHKRLVEEYLGRTRDHHPHLRQLVLRPAVILGRGAQSPLLDVLCKRVLLTERNAACQFGFALDDDVAACVVKGIHERRTGVFNVASPGCVSVRDISRITGAWHAAVPSELLRALLATGRVLRITRFRREHLLVLGHYPMLSTTALQNDFGFTPTLDSTSLFAEWWGKRCEGRGNGE